MNSRSAEQFYLLQAMVAKIDGIGCAGEMQTRGSGTGIGLLPKCQTMFEIREHKSHDPLRLPWPLARFTADMVDAVIV